MPAETDLIVRLPKSLADQLDTASRADQVPADELVRRALEDFLAARRIPVVEADPGELKAVDAGLAAIAAGDYVSWDQLRDELAAERHRTRTQSASSPRRGRGKTGGAGAR